LPAISELAGKLRVTTDPAPTTQPSPSVTPLRITTRAPIQHRRSIVVAARATLLKQIEKPLPDVKAGGDVQDSMDVPNMRGAGQQGGLNRQARLLAPSGDPEVFKVVSLVLGTPDFQRQ